MHVVVIQPALDDASHWLGQIQKGKPTARQISANSGVEVIRVAIELVLMRREDDQEPFPALLQVVQFGIEPLQGFHGNRNIEFVVVGCGVPA